MNSDMVKPEKSPLSLSLYSNLKKNTCRYHYQNLDDSTKVLKILQKSHHFTHVYQKSQSHDVWFLIWAIFCPFITPYPHPTLIPKIKFLIKNEKNAWRYYPFIHTCVP